MRLRTTLGALALSAALFCSAAVSESSAQQARTVVAGAANASAGGLYVYPDAFPCTPGPGFCRRIIIIIIVNAASVCQPTHDYSGGGTIQMAVDKQKKEAWIADINGNDIPEARLLHEGETAVATKVLEPPPGGLD